MTSAVFDVRPVLAGTRFLAAVSVGRKLDEIHRCLVSLLFGRWEPTDLGKGRDTQPTARRVVGPSIHHSSSGPAARHMFCFHLVFHAPNVGQRQVRKRTALKEGTGMLWTRMVIAPGLRPTSRPKLPYLRETTHFFCHCISPAAGCC